jgi:putative transposase
LFLYLEGLVFERMIQVTNTGGAGCVFRLIVGWAMASHREESLVEAALWMALGRRQPVEELLHHSDRGSQYTSLAYQAVLSQFHIQVSMSGKGDCYDNAMM